MCYNEFKETCKTKINYLLYIGFNPSHTHQIQRYPCKKIKLIDQTKIERNKHFQEKAYQKIKTTFGI